MNKLNSSQIFKIIIGSMWALLTLICMLLCAIPYFTFTPADFGMAEGLITAGAGILIGVEHTLNQVNHKDK